MNERKSYEVGMEGLGPYVWQSKGTGTCRRSGAEMVLFKISSYSKSNLMYWVASRSDSQGYDCFTSSLGEREIIIRKIRWVFRGEIDAGDTIRWGKHFSPQTV